MDEIVEFTKVKNKKKIDENIQEILKNSSAAKKMHGLKKMV